MRNFPISRQDRFEDEASLWEAFQQGDIQAFEVVYQTHVSALLAYGKHLCRDHDQVSDVVQDVFVDIWTRRATLRSLHTIRYYLFRIMRNKLARLRQNAVLFIDDQQTPPPKDLLTQSIEFLISQQETNQHQIAQLKQGISRLPDRQHEAIILAFYHNLSNDEIADLMGINHQSVINHLNRALASLRCVVDKAFLLLLYFVE
ncbi:RNA polymerase sigma factor [Spirosoma linguale]|uniref:RNA polymerase, sigma-24 subunit, ECF subfamily n=1 Tax=Spirosoma linguale (strain ATCC 33905 / DSM 74 / LMG 10896 / Claus 1) TaxID=504472 RepID=D2QIJ3_SPILD|nr:RNA polymerase, sigma-24 subunit, ECF subfamily [Spirosoma linguale DSM 74]